MGAEGSQADIAGAHASGGKRRIAIVTVHGTNDSAPGPDGDKWYQRGSAFTESLKQRLAPHGLEVDIVPHLWSGANSSYGREQGADDLCKKVKKCAKSHDSVHVIAHSHGGNVANMAADRMLWGVKRKRRSFTSLTTVGTPFFRIGSSPIASIGGWVFVVIVVLSALLVMPVSIALVIALLFANETDRTGSLVGALFIGGIGIGVGFLYLFMWRLGQRGLRRARKVKRKDDCGAQVFALSHPNDEAITFLKRIETIPFEPFPKGSMRQGARMRATQWGVNSALYGVILPVILGFVLLFWNAMPADVLATMESVLPRALLTNVFGVFLICSIPAVPAIFFLAYIWRRYVIGMPSEWWVRGQMNRMVADVLRDMAMGRDSDQRISQVSSGSHSLRTKEVKLEGDVAARMQAGAEAASGQLIEKYRWALFSSGEDSNASLSKLSTDAMTWNSLIHTTYFDQPEVVDLIAEYIVAEDAKLRAQAA
jgi:hypothetical protein